jgi:hypothetical protein
MKRGCMGTTTKQELSCCSGWEDRLRDPKSTSVSIKREGVDRSFMGRASLIMSLIHVFRQSMDSFTWRSWSIWGRQNEGRDLRVEKTRPGFCTTTTHVAPYLWIFSETRDNCRPPTVLPSTFGPMQSFFVHKVENHSEMPPISDDRRARRKFATGPTRYRGNRVPGLVLELQRMLEAVYREWRGVLWRRQVLLRCKLINKYFKK